MRARSALFTLFGDVVRPAGGEAWLSTITAAMGTLGFNAQAVRTALHRMAGEGWVEPRRAGRYAAYRLTDRGVARLEEAAERIYRLRTTAWDGRWRLLIAPSLGSGDADDVVAELGWMGFGRLEPGIWVSPHDHMAAATALLADLPGPLTQLDAARTPDDGALAARAWDLEGLAARHEAFLEAWSGTVVPEDPETAFGLRLRLVHQWRTFLFDDPGLPTQVLPAAWPGHRAAAVFKDVYERLLEPSWAYYTGLQAQAPASTEPVMAITPGANPFAQGLAALHTTESAGRP